MKWEELLGHFADQPLFNTSHLAVFPDPQSHILVQLSRWVAIGKLAQIRRGWYLIQKPYRTKDVSPGSIANAVVDPSYLSLEWALQFHGMIPEATFHPTSVTTKRGIRFEAIDHVFIYHHLTPSLFRGYLEVLLGGERIVVASPEKALLDLVYIFVHDHPFSLLWLESLRLQNLETFRIAEFRLFSRLVRKPGFAATADQVVDFVRDIQERT